LTVHVVTVMTLAAETREAVRRHPFLYDALRAGVVNYSAAARFLAVDGETDAVVAALRRYAEDLPDDDPVSPEAAVNMRRGLGEGDPADALLVVGATALTPDTGALTGLVASGDVDAGALRTVLGRLATRTIDVRAAAVGGDALVVVVDGQDGPDALRAVEAVLER
jgi:hypothetical protein